jgi:hypothetical protein
MTMATKIQQPREIAQRQSAIDRLARQMNAEPSHVRRLFDEEFAGLAAKAKVRSYLHVLASRAVRSALQAAPDQG